MPDFLHIVGAGGKPGDGNLTAGVGAVRPRNQRGAGRIGVDSKLPAGQVLAVLSGFRQADATCIQFVCEADCGCRTGSHGHFSWIGAGTIIHCIDGTVGMTQFLHIVSASGQPGNGNLAVAICGVRPCRKAGAGRIGIHAKPPAGEILSVLGGFRQADGSRIRGFQLEIGIQAAAGSAGQRYCRLIAGTRHIPHIVGGICGRRQIPGSPIHSGGRNRSRLRDVQSAAALVELRTVSICE